MWFQYGIVFTSDTLTSLGSDYGHNSMFSMYRKNNIINFLRFGGTTSNYIRQQPAILWLQKYGENGYMFSFVGLKILFTEL